MKICKKCKIKKDDSDYHVKGDASPDELQKIVDFYKGLQCQKT